MSKKSAAVSRTNRWSDAAWWLFLALSGFTPLFITNTSLFSGRYSAWTYDSVTLPKLTLAMMLVGLSLAAHLIAILKGESKLRFSPVMWPALGLLGWAVASTVASPSLRLSVFGEWGRFEGLAALATYVAAFVLAAQLLTDTSRLRTWMSVVSASAGVMAIYTLVQYLGLDPLANPTSVFGERVIGTLGNPDMLGTYFVLPFALSLGLAIDAEKNSRRKYLPAASSALIALALVLTLVRGAWIGAFLAVVALLVMSRGSGHRRAMLPIVAGLAGVVAVAAAWTVLSPQQGLDVAERIRTTVAGVAGSSLAQRFDVWRISLKLIAAKPLFGFGPDSFGNAFAPAATGRWWAEYSHVMLADNAHNLVLQVATTLGVPGMLLYMSSILGALATGIRVHVSRPHPLLAAAAAGTFGLAVTFLAAISSPAVALWLWLGAGAVLAPSTRAVEFDARVARPLAGVACAALLMFSALGLSWLVADSYAAPAAREGETQAAIAGTAKAEALNPLTSYYHLLRGSVLEASAGSIAQQSDPQSLARSVIAEYRTARAENPQDPTAAYQLLAATNRWDSAFAAGKASATSLRLAQQIAVRWPNVPDLNVEVARTYLAAGSKPDAEKYARHASALDPAFAGGWRMLAEVLYAEGRREEAVATLKRAAKLAPEDQQIQAELITYTQSR